MFIKYRQKLLILVALLAVSVMPLLVFAATFNWQRDSFYLTGLLNGSTSIHVDAAKDWFDVYGTYFFGMIRLSLTYVMLLFVSAIVFLTSLSLLVREYLVNRYKAHKPPQ